uniref:Uncharacterized protein n=1 Tax=viral metagenome TaxID=1070528 RepID=A0A6C0HL08_9ZZZZ
MVYKGSMDDLAKYVRERRPTEEDPLLFDREIRLLLNWLDTHKIREREVFEAQEGKEYAAMLQFVEERTGVTDFKVGTELFQKLLQVRQVSSAPSSSAAAAAAAAAAGGGESLRKRRQSIRSSHNP